MPARPTCAEPADSGAEGLYIKAKVVGGLERSNINMGHAGEADLRAEPADSGAEGLYIKAKGRWRFGAQRQN
jgi:hypothetical protein